MVSIAADSRAFPALLPFETERLQLTNGLDVHFVQMPGSGLFSYFTVVRSGSRVDFEPGCSGFAHLAEHLHFLGSKNFLKDRYTREALAIGATPQGKTGLDDTCYWMDAPREHLERVVVLESDRLRFPAFDEPAFVNEAAVVLDEALLTASDETQLAFETLLATVFEVHPYRYPLSGTEADLRGHPGRYEQMRRYIDRHYVPNNTVLVVTGDFDTAEAARAITTHLADWPIGLGPLPVPTEPPQTAPRLRRLSVEHLGAPLLALGFRGEAFSPADRLIAAGDLLFETGFGEQSDLYRELVLEQEGVYAIQGSFDMLRDASLLTVLLPIKEGIAVDRVLDQVERQIERLYHVDLDPRWIGDLISAEYYGFIKGLESPNALGESLLPSVVLTGEIAALETHFDTLCGLVDEDIRQAAQHFLRPERRTTVILEPP